MRVVGASWSCTFTIAACYVGVAWASVSNKEFESKPPNYTPQNSWPFDGQEILDAPISGKVVSGSEQQAPKESRNTDEVTLSSVQKILVTTTTKEVAVLHPKITDAPLVRRKLGSNRWDLVHNGIQGQKRDATACPIDYQLCPKSLNGGCCPNDRVCAVSSCLPTSEGPVSACGKLGYVACGISDGGGCCPESYVCGQAGCTPSAGVSYIETCGVNSYLCPASLNYGCCKSGMGCALSGCWSTSISSYTLVNTLTTTDASSHTVTITTSVLTAITPTAPTATATSGPALLPKVTSAPTAIAKTAASGTPSSGGGGLTSAEIGGIIGGAVTFLVIILAIAFFILRRLNTAIKAASDARTRTSSSGPRSGRSRPRETPDIDAMSVDPLMITGSEAGTERHHSYQSSKNSAFEVEANSPPSFSHPFSPRSPPHTHYPRGYNAVASSDSPYSNSSSGGGYRNPSLESTPPMTQTNRGYFDIPLRAERGSQGSLNRRPSQHARNWSNASEESEVSAASSGPAELAADPQRKGSILQRLGSRIASRKSSISKSASEPVLTGGPTSNPLSPRLGHIPEAAESHQRVDMTALSGTRLRQAGLSNAQLREMTMFEQNPYIQETKQ
ncbi:hypothetical protein LSUE1_G001312 [Lachnellula suecica]|uniref:Uncharacterized protein n=1 Tax=Lachnellula suecica TaxID=602035 RepID=A0A8T9CI69_9HELO|nr:hypothetical protein LSUE1_G001312 [Lachnellula suecica]